MVKLIPVNNFTLEGDDFEGKFQSEALFGDSLDITLKNEIPQFDDEGEKRKWQYEHRPASADFHRCENEDDFDRLCAAAKMAWRQIRKRLNDEKTEA